MENKTLTAEEENKLNDALLHYGILGMKWGHRKGGGAVVVRSGARGAVREIAGLAKDAVADDISKARRAAKAVTDNKVFKAAIYDKTKPMGGLVKTEKIANDIAAGKKLMSKVAGSKAFKTMVFDKEKFQQRIAQAKGAGKAALIKMADRINRNDIKAYDRDISLFKSISKRYDEIAKIRPLTMAERKDKVDFDQATKRLEDELANVFTPEELKKYRS